jgi:superfamily II DNA or RNA helicase
LGYKVNQFTAEENIKDRMQIVDSFNKGIIDSLAAIRCLDEGINIPSIKGALILSSNDDYREFVQRRGRILRTYTNEYSGEKKECANIYDVVVLPPSNQNFAQIELRRFYEYASLADNSEYCMRELEDLLIRYGLEMEDIVDLEENEDDLDE